jgi:hypothetical protein
VSKGNVACEIWDLVSVSSRAGTADVRYYGSIGVFKRCEGLIRKVVP